jgi:hypothetical protein
MIYKIKQCKHCNKEFNDIEGRVFSNHVKWCNESPTRHIQTNSKQLLAFYDKSKGQYKDFNVKCHKCKKDFIVNERESKFPSKVKYYCNRSCANSRKITDEHKKKTSDSMLKTKTTKHTKCKNCNKLFEYNRRIYCSNECLKKKTIKDNGSLKDYRRKCAFKFSLNEYPNEFDFTLIEQYGWYKPKNRGDNLYGVSRDHIVSVRYGYDNNIDPELISHPANCRLMLHSDNSKKHSKCDMTIDQLIEKIKIWNDLNINILQD